MSDTDEPLTSADLDDLLHRGVWKAQDVSGTGAGFSLHTVAIASGASRKANGRLALSVTLLMQPVYGSDGALPNLPSEIATWAADGLDLLIDTSSPQVALPRPTMRPLRLQVGDLGKADDQVKDLWQRLMAPAVPAASEVNWWTVLADALPQTLPLAAAVEAGNNPQTAIVPVPRGISGVSISLRRAKNVRARVKGIMNGRRADAELWRTASLDRGDEHLMVDPPYRLAANALGSVLRPADYDRTPAEVAQDALLRSRRAVAKPLADAHAHAADLAKKERDYVAGSNDGEQLRKSLTRTRSSNADSPASTCKAIEEADVAFCQDQNAKHRALHFAATDHGQDVAVGRDFNKALGKAPDPPEKFTAKQAAEAAQRRLQMLEGLPRLARLFNLVVEASVEVDPVELRGGAVLGGAQDVFVSLAAQFAGGHGGAPIWTRAKLTIPSASDQAPQFWPCTEEEIDAHRVPGGCADDFRTAISQRAGIVDLGAVDLTTEGDIDPRFDLITVDTVAGTEAEINQEIANYKQRQLAERAGGPETEPAFVTLRSAGLCLVDRWRHEAAAKTAARAAKVRQQPLGNVVLDAKMLELGWRIDVGIHSAEANRTSWRSLGNRMIDLHDPARPFGDPGAPCGSWIEARLAARDASLSVDERAVKRIRLDGSYVAAPLRQGSHALDPAQDTAKTAMLHADNLLAQWEGDPLGIECNRQIAFTQPGDDLAITQIHKPVTRSDGPSLLPPPLRFGQRYRVGARVVYRGGVVQPLDQARELYRTMMGGTSVLPADIQGTEGRAVLRHERIGPVAVTQTRVRVESGTKDRYGVPQGLTAVLRQAVVAKPTPHVEGDLGTPAQRRVLVAPNVGLAFATLHGVFDRLDPRQLTSRNGQTRPPDGLVNVAFATHPVGGFPMLSKDGRIRADIGEFDRVTGQLNLHKDLRGDAVFQVVDGGEDALSRPLPYYPDPAARFMVIRAVRTLGPPDFAGEPIVVPLYGDGAAYPKAMPVVVDIEQAPPASDEGRIDDRKQADVIKFDATEGTGFLDKGEYFVQRDRWPSSNPGPRVPVRRVHVLLRPGDDITLEVWCIPDLDRLARWFDVVESGAILLASGDKATAENTFACLQKLAQETGCKAPPAAGPSSSVNACGAGGLKLPAKPVLTQWASALHQALKKEPIPEVASVQHIQAIYATSRPQFVPGFAPQTFDASQRLTYVRRKKVDPEQRQAFVAENTELARWRPGKPDDRRDGLDQEGATDVMFAGTIRADLDAGDAITLFGSFASPANDRLDDERRGFAPGQLAQYERRQLDLTENGDIFGFTVDRDGRVRFRPSQVALMTMRNLARSIPHPGHRGLEDVDLLADLRPPDEHDRDRPRPSVWRYTFKDNLARHLSLSLGSEGRFGPYFGNRQGPATTRSSDERKDPAEAATTLWIDATRRPSRIDPKSLLPAFVWVAAGMSVQRQTVVRIRFKRPWFSSGEGERLGIVIWPTDLFAKSPGEIGREYPSLPWDPRLGRGDAYVTRWGSDPIRKGATPDGWLVPREVFSDYDARTGKFAKDVHFVKDVAMPLPAPDTTDTSAVTTVSLPAQSMVDVSLLTYEPRFDPVQALWYVDVGLNALDLPDPFIRLGLVRYQEHAARNLQVSEPVVEWVQLLPQRTVTVKRSTPRPGDKSVTIDVEVHGHGSIRSAVEDPTVDSARQAKRDRPIMRAELSQRRKIGDTQHYEEHAVIGPGGKPVMAVDDNAQRSADGLSWKLQLHAPIEPDAATRFRVYVEEVMRMLPADVFREDANPDDVETGPRFAAHIDL
jgi:hypothetical protein